METLIVDSDGSKDAASVFPLPNLSRSPSLAIPITKLQGGPSQWGVIVLPLPSAQPLPSMVNCCCACEKLNKLVYWNVFVCCWVVELGFNMASTVTASLLSKQLPDSWNGRTSFAVQYSNYIGHVTGAIWGGSGVHIGMLGYIGLEIALIGIGAILFFVFWQSLKTKTR
ncbi:hypothetical protein BDQ12DRAFT_666210 [Crucibulum laeve]|uniref:Major facilitator superfamily domain-containing protein n=1 Tax=Crucibulum laeve TaxID=68775 RepID=A0A5C3M033_9AGAR|nr:hypothetical protein BDQ12DRAFT_666210 [Crucibulum laeve]